MYNNWIFNYIKNMKTFPLILIVNSDIKLEWYWVIPMVFGLGMMLYYLGHLCYLEVTDWLEKRYIRKELKKCYTDKTVGSVIYVHGKPKVIPVSKWMH